MNGLIAWFARNEVAANLLMVLIVGLGLQAAWQRIPLEVFPEIARDVITVSVVYRGATPAEVERGAVIRIEEAIADLPGIAHIYSDALEGAARLRIELDKGVDPRAMLEDVKGRVDAISTFPADVERPVLAVLQRKREVIGVVLHGALDEHGLHRLAEQVRDELLALPGITLVDFSGLRRYELSIEIPAHTLRALDLTLADVARAIRRYARDIPAGSIRTAAGEVLLRSLGQAYHAEQFARIPVLTRPDGTRITLGQIATIDDGFEEDPLYALFDGQRAAEVNVYRTGGQSAIRIADTVKAYIERKRAELPPGIEIDYWRDRSRIVKARLQTLLKSALQGGLLIFLLLTLFLRLSVALWVLVGIPLSFMGALALMPELGVTLNLISLFAFIVVLGIVVDDAIVVAENIYTRLKASGDPTRAAIEGTREVAVPVVFGVLTTVVAFLPLLFVSGVRGKLWAQIPAIIIPVLLFSLIESKLILPAHMKHVRPDDGRRRNAWQRFQRAIADGLERGVARGYRPLLDAALRHRYLTVALFVSLSLVVMSFVLSGRYRFVFFPRVQSEVARVTLEMPPGTPLAVTEAHLRRITDAARRLQDRYREPDGQPIIRHIYTTVGQAGSTRGGGTQGQSHIGRVSFEILPPEQRTLAVTSSQLVREWRRLIGPVPGARQLTFKAEIGHGGEPIDVQLIGQDFARLRAAAAEVKARLATYPGVFDIRDSLDNGKAEIRLRLKPGAETLGVSLAELGEQVRHAFFGAEAQRIQRGRDDLRVMVRLPAAERHRLATLRALRIRTADGAWVPLETVAELSLGRGFTVIQRVDRQRTLDVTADIDKERADLPAISADLAAWLPELLARHPGLRYRFEGEQKEQAETFSSLRVGTAFVLFAIYALLAIPFRSYLQPLIVMAVIPFSIVGAVLGHMVMGMDLSIMSVMGMIALAGVVVNDSLVLVDFVNRRRREGLGLEEAIRRAGVARFRPILLTSLTTFVGLVPLIFEKSTQAQFLIPMAVSLGFGILYATFLSLLLVPVGYRIGADLRRLLPRRGRALEGQPGH